GALALSIKIVRMALGMLHLRSAVSLWTPIGAVPTIGTSWPSLEQLFDCTDVFVTSFSVRRACFQFIEIKRAWVGVQPLPQSAAVNCALGRQLASERFDQRLIRPQKPRRQLVPDMRKGIGACQCLR